ncbi:MAG: hypothetical protein BGO01_10810 [Armatimonadetes bacterium 55-13]|nr:TatD family hydrolase [Armatimonadota bacterium]OJU62883.1 MAG: hypothetical protein BGO01_10810 [Armatimonadetes bacterium 55-13]
MLIDTHCHLNFREPFPDTDAEIAFAKESGVEQLIVVGCDLESSRRAIELAEQHKEIFAVVGIHPNYSADYKTEWISEIEAMLRHSKVVALGEIGLDYHWDYATREQQYDVLKDQLALGDALNVPLVFHCREANSDLLDILEAGPERKGRVLLHCFSGNQDEARRAEALDMYFGVDGPLTYKSAQQTREIFQALRRDRVVIETDSPYLTPVPHRGKPNRPGYVTFVNNMLASLWKISADECASITTENARRFFRLP